MAGLDLTGGKKEMRRAALLVLGVTSIAALVFFLSSGRRHWTVFSQDGPAYYSVHMYVSYQFHTLNHPTGLLLLTPNRPDIGPGYFHLFIADSGNHVIREFTSTIGTLDLVAGQVGIAGYVNGYSAQFSYPTGLTGTTATVRTCTGITRDTCTYSDYQTLYINDSQNYVVRKVSTNDGNVTTACGTHTAGLVDGPSLSACFFALGGITDNAAGTCYIADAGNHALRQWDGSSVTTFAGTGYPGFVDGYRTTAQFYVPGKTTQDSQGNLYVADIENHSIRKIDTSGNVTTFCGGGPTRPGYVNGQGSAACFTRPTSIAFNPADNMIYVADSHNNVIRRIDMSGNVSTYASTGHPGLVNGSLAQAQFSMPIDLVIRNGVMYISDTMNNVIRRIDMNAGIVSTYIS